MAQRKKATVTLADLMPGIRDGKTISEMADEHDVDEKAVVSALTKGSVRDSGELLDPHAARAYEILRLAALENYLYAKALKGDAYSAQLLLGVSDRRLRLLGQPDDAYESVTEAFDKAVTAKPPEPSTAPLMAATRSLCQRLDWLNAYGDADDTPTVSRLAQVIAQNLEALGLTPKRKPVAASRTDESNDGGATATLLKFRQRGGVR